MSRFTDELIGRELRGTTADTALILRALQQAKEQFEWIRDEYGIQMRATRELLTNAIQEAEKLQ